MIKRLTDVDISVYRQSKSSMYSLLQHSKLEYHQVPVNTNLLYFLDPKVEMDYNKEIYLTDNKISEEFRLILINFYIIFTFALILLIAFAGLLYNNGKMEDFPFVIHASVLSLLLLALYTILVIVLRSNKSLLVNKTIFTMFGLVANTYFIICDNKVLLPLIGKDYNNDGLPLSLALISFSYIMKSLLLDCYSYYLLFVIHAILLFLIMNLKYSPFSMFSTLSEISIIILILSFQAIESNLSTLRSKWIF